jgi:hypothetical protein
MKHSSSRGQMARIKHRVRNATSALSLSQIAGQCELVLFELDMRESTIPRVKIARQSRMWSLPSPLQNDPQGLGQFDRWRTVVLDR